MSHATYNRQWVEGQAQLRDLMYYELPLEPPKPEKDRKVAFQFLATMFVKYVQVLCKIERCYDQIVHPQKRRVLRHVLDGTIGRVLELKNEMVNLEFSEFHYYDDILSDYKLTPSDIELPIPKYFLFERKKTLKERENLLNSILGRMGMLGRDGGKEKIQLSFEDAIQCIQKSERARQGRLRAKFMKEIRQQEEREKRAETKGLPSINPDGAATKIQKVWKGYLQRKRTVIERETELIFLGMNPPPPPVNPKNTPEAIAAQTMDKRRATQELYEQEYQQTLITIKDRIRDNEGSDLKERMQDQIRQWFIECRDATGKFPDYPEEEDGGSAMIFQEKDPAELEAELKAKEDEEEQKKKEKSKEKKGKKKKDKKGKKSKDSDKEEYEGWKMSPSQFVPVINDGSEKYKNVWSHRDESDNFMQKHDTELIKEEKRVEVETEIRVQVDELMREELKNLKMAVDREKAKKKGKKSGKKKKKGSGKKGKKKKEKDLTPDRSIESLYEELVMQGIIIPSPKVNLFDYLGDYGYLGTILRQAGSEPMPSLSDIRRVITLFAILPLGSTFVHEKSPLIKSILLAGPRGTGKKMLVHAICTETGASLFDLSAPNLVGKYGGKEGLKMLMHLIMKVGRAIQPSVFYIGDCERMFKKKIPKTDPTNPKRLTKDLPKVIKTIKNEDRILLVGTSRCPYEAEMKPLSNLYQKIILVPRPDYSSRYKIWQKMVPENRGQVTSNFDMTSLAKLSDGYTPGHIISVIQTVLTDRRVNQQAKKPLQAIEFLTPLARIDPIFKEEEEVFKEWYTKTPLGKKRIKAAKGDDEEDGGKGSKTKKGKKGKKK